MVNSEGTGVISRTYVDLEKEHSESGTHVQPSMLALTVFFAVEQEDNNWKISADADANSRTRHGGRKVARQQRVTHALIETVCGSKSTILSR